MVTVSMRKVPVNQIRDFKRKRELDPEVVEILGTVEKLPEGTAVQIEHDNCSKGDGGYKCELNKKLAKGFSTMPYRPRRRHTSEGVMYVWNRKQKEKVTT